MHDFGPTFEEIIAEHRPAHRRIESWVEELRDHYRAEGAALDKPLDVATLLRFGYEIGTPTGEEGEPFDDVEDYVEQVHEWGLVQWLSRAASELPVVERTAQAVSLTTSWWVPVLERLDEPNTPALRQLVQDALVCSRGSRHVLERVLGAQVGLPPSKPPPPYVGHYRGAINALLAALAAPPGIKHLGQSLQFAVVAPDGTSRVREIAAVVEGG